MNPVVVNFYLFTTSIGYALGGTIRTATVGLAIGAFCVMLAQIKR